MTWQNVGALFCLPELTNSQPWSIFEFFKYFYKNLMFQYMKESIIKYNL